MEKENFIKLREGFATFPQKFKQRVFTEKNISDGKEMSDNINDTINETDFASVEDSLNMHRTASNEVTYV